MAMRLFVAIDINRAIRDRIDAVQQRLRRDFDLSDRAVKWVRSDQIHLTLKFLGQVRDRDVTAVCDAVTRTAAAAAPFAVEVRGLGAFGRPARVVWAALAPSAPLTALQASLDRRLTDLGAPVDSRAFAGHLTLCRVKNAAAGRVLADAMDGCADEPFGTIHADAVQVYQSVLDRLGPEYSVICRAPLQG